MTTETYEFKGPAYLARKLNKKRERVLLRHKYYEQKNNPLYRSKLIPNEYRWMVSCLGWCSKAVDELQIRMNFNEFRNDKYNFNDLYSLNNPDILFDSAILSALISSCSFIYIHEEDGVQKMQVVEGYDATGIVDQSTGMLIEGYAVLERDADGRAISSAYFQPGMTTYFDKKSVMEVRNPAKYPTLVPVVYRPDARRPFGHSRISRAAMSFVDQAIEELTRTRISSEFYSFPQKYVLGMSGDTEFNSTYANYSNFLRLDKDEDGDKPSVGQFQSGSMSPHFEYMRMLAAQFASETGLTLDDLGFPTANPSTGDSIKASHESLRLIAIKAEKSISVGLKNAGFIASCLKNGVALERNMIADVKCAWEPLFVPGASELAVIGDGILKIEQAKPGYVSNEKMYDLVGF